MPHQNQKLPQKYTEMYRQGYALYQQAKFAEAVPLLKGVVDSKPKEADPYKLYAYCLAATGAHQDALDFINIAIKKAPDDAELYIMQANSHLLLGHFSLAREGMEKVLDRFGDDVRFLKHYVTFCTHSGAEHYQKGLDAAHKVLEKDPEDVSMLSAIGIFLQNVARYSEAANFFIKALRIQPDYMPALVNISDAFDKMNQSEMAVKFYDSILHFQPDSGLALCAKATVFCKQGFAQEYVGMMERGLEKLNTKDAYGSLITFLSNYVFFIHYVPNVPRQKIHDIILRWYEIVCRDVEEKPRLSFDNEAVENRRLRVGLISSCFKKHPVTWMTLAGLQNMDRAKFEFYCYSDLPLAKRDDVTKRYFSLCDKVREINGKSNPEVMELMRRDELDILLELTGHSEGGHRLKISAARVAPVQVKWVGGLFDTTGVPAMDWMLGDKIEIPEGDEKWYTERVYRMPDDYIVYEPPGYVSDVVPLPALKNGYITFSNLNNLAKTNTYTIELWSKILKAVPKSRLLMKVTKLEMPSAKQQVEKEFAKHGIGVDRLILEGGEQHKLFMEAYNRVDIALDPHPYTGGLSTCEALWMGVPVITLPGETFAGKHAATHLYNAGLPDWIAHDEADYIALAVKWANDLEGLSKLREGLREQVRASPLCDGPRFARNLEKALRFMWKDWCDEKRAAN